MRLPQSGFTQRAEGNFDPMHKITDTVLNVAAEYHRSHYNVRFTTLVIFKVS